MLSSAMPAPNMSAIPVKLAQICRPDTARTEYHKAHIDDERLIQHQIRATSGVEHAVAHIVISK